MVAVSDRKLIQLLYKYGHFRNDDRTVTELAKLSLKDESVVTAIASYQEFHSEALEQLSFKHHFRTHMVDGDVGPATRELLSLPRCGCSDFGPTGTGSWPKNCFGLGPNHHFVMQHDERNLPAWVPARTIFPIVIAAYLDVGLHMSWSKRPGQYHTLISYTSLRGPIGLATVPSRPNCNTRIWAKFERSYKPKDVINIWARLYAHELGHNMGLQHTRGGIMNASLIGGKFTTTAWRNDPSWNTLRRFFS